MMKPAAIAQYIPDASEGLLTIFIADGLKEITLCTRIAGMVAAMTESDPRC